MDEKAFDALSELATDVAALTVEYLAEGRDLDEAWSEKAAPLFDALPALFSALEASRQRESEARDKALEEVTSLIRDQIEACELLADDAEQKFDQKSATIHRYDAFAFKAFLPSVRALKSNHESKDTQGDG